jgi:hypothetical protein
MAVRPRPRTAGKAGFALPMVLGMVTVLALIFLVCMAGLRSLQAETRATLSDVEFERTAMTAEARMAFLAVTEPFGRDGLRVGGSDAAAALGTRYTPASLITFTSLLNLDARPYRWREASDNDAGPYYLASVQDEAGLLNIFQADSGMVSRLLQAAGLASGDGDQIASELIDYNAQPAPHQPIQRLAELYSLPSGRTLIADKVWRALNDFAVVHPDSRAVNMNTAPRQVLKAWFDLTDNQADQAIQDRQTTPFTRPADIGVTVIDNTVNYASPGGRLRFSLTNPTTGLTYRSTIVLTPTNQERPLWIENSKIQHLPPPEPPADDIEDFPEIPTGSA